MMKRWQLDGLHVQKNTLFPHLLRKILYKQCALHASKVESKSLGISPFSHISWIPL